MRIVVTMADGHKYQIEPTDHDQFFNEETGGYGAIPAFFYGYRMDKEGNLADEPTNLLGIDVRRVNYT